MSAAKYHRIIPSSGLGIACGGGLAVLADLSPLWPIMLGLAIFLAGILIPLPGGIDEKIEHQLSAVKRARVLLLIIITASGMLGLISGRALWSSKTKRLENATDGQIAKVDTIDLTERRLSFFRCQPDYRLSDAVYLWHGLEPQKVPRGQFLNPDYYPRSEMYPIAAKFWSAITNNEIPGNEVRFNGSIDEEITLLPRAPLIDWAKKENYPIPAFLREGAACD